MHLLRGLFGGQLEEEQEDTDVLEGAEARVEGNPQDAGAHFDLGSLHYVRGNLEEAVKSLERSIELDPDSDNANYMLGLAYERLGRRADAVRSFEIAGEKTDNAMLQGYIQQKLQAFEGAEAEEQELA